jgi:hypothetical protein
MRRPSEPRAAKLVSTYSFSAILTYYGIDDGKIFFNCKNRLCFNYFPDYLSWHLPERGPGGIERGRSSVKIQNNTPKLDVQYVRCARVTTERMLPLFLTG